jgi:hypothetical protein
MIKSRISSINVMVFMWWFDKFDSKLYFNKSITVNFILIKIFVF